MQKLSIDRHNATIKSSSWSVLVYCSLEGREHYLVLLVVWCGLHTPEPAWQICIEMCGTSENRVIRSSHNLKYYQHGHNIKLNQTILILQSCIVYYCIKIRRVATSDRVWDNYKLRLGIPWIIKCGSEVNGDKIFTKLIFFCF